MKKIPYSIEEKLLDYLDGGLNEQQIAEVEGLINRDPEIKKRLEELREIHHTLSGISTEQPSRNFTSHVMEGLDQYTARNGISVRNSIFLLVTIILTIGIAAMLSSAGVFDGTAQIDLNTMVTQNDFIKQSLPSFNINGKWLVNAIIVLNLIIAFFVLDKTILKPFFEQRTKFNS